jgi:hypothetical protein
MDSFSKIIDIQQYDSSISQLFLTKKAEKEEVYVMGLGRQNIVVYDVTNCKMERMEIEGKVSQM